MDIGNMEPVHVNEIQGVWLYLKQIDFSEPWFTGLGIFHLTCFMITASTRNSSMLQCLHFMVLLLLVFFAEMINEWAANNWKLFARQQYFDSNGLFISVVFSTPVLINCLVIVVLWLKDMSFMMSETRLLRMTRKEDANAKKQGAEESKKDQ
ncbi:transmembrane protein 18-like [Mizuhopecten yessoensis]|uniref:Transmembrane protein 18 n=1 Tax=Mizuhopecten yessoensis TaxID=6573 RepID=A0A210QWE4_MIZYE|nr:transmembrane protein 18-like [Mizuhopecten yessoensis]OWF53060.1 Transmembrane protein 18 [Mizuhopecten yessoensis]